VNKGKYIVKEKNPAAVALGKLSAAKVGVNEMAKRGRMGGRARAAALTPERRSEIGRIAVAARREKALRSAEAAEKIDRLARELAKELYGDPYEDLL